LFFKPFDVLLLQSIRVVQVRVLTGEHVIRMMEATPANVRRNLKEWIVKVRLWAA